MPAPGGRLAWIVPALFTGVIAATYALGVYLFPALLPDMHRRLGFSYAAAGEIAAARQVAFLVPALASAAVVFRFGGGAVILGSVVLSGVALCASGLADNATIAAGLLIVLNACAASAWIPMVALVSTVVGYRNQGKAVGLIASGTNYGLCLLVPALLPGWGWRSVWLTAGGLTLLLSSVVGLVLARASLLTPTRRSATRSAVRWRMALRRQYWIVFGLAFLGGLAGVPFANYLSASLRDDLHLSAGVAGAC